MMISDNNYNNTLKSSYIMFKKDVGKVIQNVLCKIEYITAFEKVILAIKCSLSSIDKMNS